MIMTGISSTFARSFHTAIGPCFKTRFLRPFICSLETSRVTLHPISLASLNLSFEKHSATDWPWQHNQVSMSRLLICSSLAESQSCKTDGRTYSTALLVSNQSLRNMLNFGCTISPMCLSAKFHHRTYSSHSGSKQDSFQTAIENVSTSEASNGGNSGTAGNNWLDMLDHARQSISDVALGAEKKAKDLYDYAFPYLQQLYDRHPYLEKVIVPVTVTVSATLLAWFVMPRILRKLHKYASQGPLALLYGNSTAQQITYEKSLWSALEDPTRYLITFVAFSQLGAMIAPTTAVYLSQAWRGAVVLSFIWFLHRWKTNFFTRALSTQVTAGLDRDKLLTLEKLSSVGLIILGVMGLAEALGVPLQSIVTVGGIGGVATAFAARDVLGNLLSGLSLQFSKPFGVGDNIKAGSVEGQVMEMGLTTTSLLNPEKFPVIVPNSLFSSQVIVNKSRAQRRASLTKVPVFIEDIKKIPLISEDIKSMLRAHPKVFPEKDTPYCYLSRLEYKFAELTIGCNLRSMRKDELFATEQDILLQAARIIQLHGAELGSTQNDRSNC
ncbi:mechanosensitive ion channel protein 1, mitochondrial isoform X1 [Canna indica]|uniref:Mechanosensitive ion channel protein 1, mitochondrial isoform X1 n=1 Tax=Canna indica TaxID=4628 RepID=A0AAQ3QF60_9LILI|nr:mechanosensitive ion channel protein 1, mitochondrial isoform X1 [Canna indica]